MIFRALANVRAQLRYRGVVAACGVAQGWDLPADLTPFLRRSATLIGIDSVMAPRELRVEAWRRLASDLDLGKLEQMVRVVGLTGILQAVDERLSGTVRGRTVIDVNA